MVKYRSAGDNAAYEIAVGITDAEEAAKLGLAVVEVNPTTGAPSAYGRYKGAPDGGPLGITVAKSGDTDVVAGGDVGAPAGEPVASTSGKGNLINPNDPVIHGGSDEIHADGSPPPVVDDAADLREATEAAEASNDKVRKAASKAK